jgi:hypothetical protein
MAAQPPEADIENALSNLQRLSDEDLKRCIEDEEYFENFVANLPQVYRYTFIAHSCGYMDSSLMGCKKL